MLPCQLSVVMPTSPVKTRIPLTSFGHLITEVKVRTDIRHCCLPCMRTNPNLSDVASMHCALCFKVYELSHALTFPPFIILAQR